MNPLLLFFLRWMFLTAIVASAFAFVYWKRTNSQFMLTYGIGVGITLSLILLIVVFIRK